MKKKYYLLLSLLSTTVSFYSCTSSKSSVNPKSAEITRLNRSDYNLLQTTEGVATSDRIWLLFIPFGGKTDRRMYEIAYNKGVENLNQDADGILEPRYEYKRLVVPLIVATYVHKEVKVKGKAYRLKTDTERH